MDVVDISQGAPDAGVPEIVHIDYDLWTLRITVRYPTSNEPAYVIFRDVRGFRVLDEGDLIEFWSHDPKPGGWIWEIKDGGWLHKEGLRPGFISSHLGGLREFLVSGINDCVSVMGFSNPTVDRPSSKSLIEG